MALTPTHEALIVVEDVYDLVISDLASQEIVQFIDLRIDEGNPDPAFAAQQQAGAVLETGGWIRLSEWETRNDGFMRADLAR